VQDYLNEKKITHFTAANFVNHYEAVNWFRGKTKIKSWKACVSTWNKSEEKQKSTYGMGAI